MGAWAEKSFKINSVFGPYKGVKVYENSLSKLNLTINGGNAWEVSSVIYYYQVKFELTWYISAIA